MPRRVKILFRMVRPITEIMFIVLFYYLMSRNQNSLTHYFLFFELADSPLQFPVDDEVRVMTPNQVYDSYEGTSDEKGRTRYPKQARP